MAVHRRRVLAVWLIAVALGLVGLPRLLGSLMFPPIEVSGSQSQRAGEVLAAGLPSFGRDQVVAVLNSPQLRATDPVFRSAIKAGMGALGRQGGVAGVVLLPVAGDPRPPAALAEALEPLRGLFQDPHTAYLWVGVSGDDRQRQDRVAAQQAAVDEAAQAASGGAVRAYLVGTPAFSRAAQQAEIADLMRIELVAVPVAVLVLLLGLRAPVAAAVPLAVAGASVVSTLGVFAALAGVVPVDGLLLIGVNAMGLAVGVDYGLFVVARCREEMAAGASPQQAVVTAMATTGRTVVYTGLIFILAAASLFLVRWHVYTQFAVGAMGVVAVALAASVTLLPALLVSLAGKLEWRPRWMPQRASALGGATSAQGRLVRWARHLMRHPWPYAVAAAAGLVLLAAPAPSLTLGVDLERHALADTADMTGHTIMDREVPGLTSTVFILLKRMGGTVAPDVGPLVTALRADPEVAAASTLDNSVDLTIVVAVPRHPPDSPAVVGLVQRIREQIAPTVAPPGHPMLVGGPSAQIADILDETSTKLWLVVGIVLTLTVLLLVVMLRSLLLPVKAVVMTLLASGAALGLMVAVFLLGAAEEPSGWSGPGVVWPQVPMLVLVLLFALSTDYELFLVRRIQEEYRATGDNTESVAAGLQRTAGTISLAAVIIAVAFGSLLVAQLNGVRQLGFALAAGVVLDATVVRLVLVPALMRILGRWNWWLPSLPRQLAGSRVGKSSP